MRDANVLLRNILPCLGLAGLLLMGGAAASRPASRRGVPSVPAVVALRDKGVVDQDDMCFWKHPQDPAKSVVISSDKFGNRLCVYDLSGKVLQVIRTPFPGNIDSRTGFSLGGRSVDIIVHNQRTKPHYKLRAYRVDPAARKLVCIDNGAIRTGSNYGGALYHSKKTGKFYFFTTSKQGNVEQIELSDDGQGRVAGRKVRAWRVGMAEGAVADDAAAVLFVAQERRGIWAFAAEPTDPTRGRLIAPVGQNGLRADVEGLTILPVGEKDGYLIASSQGNHTFKVYGRAAPHDFIGTFNVTGSVESDGIDVAGGNFGAAFPGGIFACHSGRNRARCPVLLASWRDIAAALGR